MNSGTRKTAIAGLALLAAMAILAAVYGKWGQDGNRQAESACSASGEMAARIEGLNTGDVAAFQIADTPKFVGDLKFEDETGSATGLTDHLGQTVLLNLWATWCAPCLEEMPALAELQRSAGSPAFQVLPVSMDSGAADKPKRFYAENGLEALPFRHDGSLATFNSLKKRGIAFGMPTTVLVDGNGCALGWMNGPADWAGADARAMIDAALGG